MFCFSAGVWIIWIELRCVTQAASETPRNPAPGPADSRQSFSMITGQLISLGLIYAVSITFHSSSGKSICLLFSFLLLFNFMVLNSFSMFDLIHTLTTHKQLSLLHKVIIFQFLPPKCKFWCYKTTSSHRTSKNTPKKITYAHK